MITSLELKNWRTHKESKLEFGKGTNVIIGIMGSGKSSIMNALSYSLFGTFPALKAKQVSLSEIIMNKPNIHNEAEAIITFEQNNKKFLVERKIKDSGTNEAKLYEDGKLIAGPKQKDVNEKVENILGLNYELFSRAVYSEQNELDFFLKLSPMDRKRKFDELLEIDKYEIARKNSLSLKNTIIKDNKQKKEFIEQQKKTMESHEENKLIERIKQEEKSIAELDEKKEKIRLEIEKIKNEVEELVKKEKEYSKLKDIISREKTKLETLNKNISGKKIIDFETLENHKANVEKTLKETESNKSKNLKQKEDFEKTKSKMNEEISVLDYKLKTLEKELKEIEKLQGDCPTCKQKMNEAHKKELISKILKELEANKQKKKEIENKKTEIEPLLKEIIETDKKISNKIEELRENYFEIINQEKNTLELEKIKKEITELEKELPKKEKELKKLNFDNKNFEKKKKNYFETKSMVELINSQIKSKKELKASFESNLDKVEKIKKSIEELEKEYDLSERVSEKLGIFENCLISTQTELRETMLETINTAMSKIWENIYPYNDFVDAKLSVVESGYDLQVKTRKEEWVRVEGILSGGERSAAALCIRIAFALVLTKQLSMLILDEPTHNLDRNAMEKLSEVLRDSLPKLVEQIFVITHDKEMENSASGNLYLLKRNKDLDEATKIEIIER